MTRYSDNIYSGYQATTSAASSKSAVVLRKVFTFSAVGGTAAITRNATLPPGVENVTSRLYVTQQASATVSNKITVSAGGFDMITVTQFGSATGTAGDTKAGFALFTYIASACATPPVPTTGANNGGEIPIAVTFVPVSADKTGTYKFELSFNRADSNTLGVTA